MLLVFSFERDVVFFAPSLVCLFLCSPQPLERKMAFLGQCNYMW